MRRGAGLGWAGLRGRVGQAAQDGPWGGEGQRQHRLCGQAHRESHPRFSICWVRTMGRTTPLSCRYPWNNNYSGGEGELIVKMSAKHSVQSTHIGVTR